VHQGVAAVAGDFDVVRAQRSPHALLPQTVVDDAERHPPGPAVLPEMMIGRRRAG
jgi:hypothetical protein